MRAGGSNRLAALWFALGVAVVGLTGSSMQSGGGPARDAAAIATPPDCAPERMAGGREIRLAASTLQGAPLTADRLGLRAGEFVLTFDDGPTWVTEEILDTLDRHCAKAVFFMIGARAEARPLTVRRAARDGHTLGNHTYGHVNLLKLTEAQAGEQIRRGREAVAKAAAEAAEPVILLRAPAFGVDAAARRQAARLGAVEVGPDISPKDWRGDPPAKTMLRLMATLERKDRGVILLHDNQPNTRALLKLLLAEFVATGRKAVSVKITR